MKKKRVTILFIILLLVGLGSITISFKDFFFATRYYEAPLDAYNEAYGGIDTVTGEDLTATKEIGIFQFSDQAALFLGDLEQTGFVVDQMVLKNGKYASKGPATVYGFDAESKEDDSLDIREMETGTGTVSWAVLYNAATIDTLSDVKQVETYRHSSGRNIYLVIFN